MFWDTLKTYPKRIGQARAGTSSFAKPREIWQCKDGWIVFSIYGGQMGSRINKALVQWMHDENLADEFVDSLDWDTLDMSNVSPEIIHKIEEKFGGFFLAYSKAELFKEAVARGINLDPISNPPDLLNYTQLNARNFWIQVNHPELNMGITYPGSFFISTEVPCKIEKRAPLIGEHNQEIYRDRLGLSNLEIKDLVSNGII
jgi:crotonobetainyl-CoA:carnitine CoA-transferase CaiB-like acyl-CoA transferase